MMNFAFRLLFGNRFDEFPWACWNFNSVYQSIPSFLLCEVVYSLNFLICVFHLLTQNNRTVRARQLILFLCALLGGIGNDVIFSFLPVVDNFFHSQAALMVTPRFPLYILFYYISWLYVPTTLLLSHRNFFSRGIFTNASLISMLCAIIYWPWDIVGAKFVWWTWHTTDNSLRHRYLGVPLASTLWTVVFCFVWGGLYHGTSVGSPPSWGQSLRATLSVFLFSVPMMMVIMGTMTSITGGVTTPMLLLCVILMLVTFLIFSLRYGNNKEESGNTTGTLGTTKNLEWIYTCVILHYAYLMFTIYYYDPKIQISTGVHQTFGPCGVEGIDMSGLKRSIYTCGDDLNNSNVHHSFQCTAGVSSNRRGLLRIIEPSMEHRKWYTVCGKFKSTSWMVNAAICIAGSFVSFMSVLHLSRKTTSANVSNPKHRKND